MICDSPGIAFYTLLLALAPQAGDPLPLLRVTRDDTRITHSARIVIPAGLVLQDKQGDGVLQIVADDVRLVFEPGSVLRGAPAGEDPDRHTGVGVRIHGQRGVQLEGLHVAGFKTGVWATNAHALTIVEADLSDNFAQRLASTPQHCDDGADWLACHDNDSNEWRTRYGAGIYVEDSRELVVHNCRARRTQNGLLLDRVEGALVYDNDFSFLSGWGLGLWRSSDNMVSRNAFDFCIRGYSHGRYNRGQDSAGILIFEQCSRNDFVFNSATHGGDGVFGFAGREALGQLPSLGKDFDATRRGNNDNSFLANDFSYAAAHGLEMTFSFGNRVKANRFIGNGICGIWGGYSQDMDIANNRFESNGDAGYGAERGGINIEHSARNRIANNRFKGNACGVHLWWDSDESLLATPWAKANGSDCSGNVILSNRFECDLIGIELRSCQPTVVADNEMIAVGIEIEAGDEALKLGLDTGQADSLIELAGAPGEAIPVGARANLAGRENIVMGAWGPWDHESPYAQLLDSRGGEHVYVLHNFAPDAALEFEGEAIELSIEVGTPRQVHLKCSGEGLFPYSLRIGTTTIEGLIEHIEWDITTFGCSFDPREDAESWRAALAGAPPSERRRLALPYASGGPRELGLPTTEGTGNDHFGTLATTLVALPAGEFELRSTSDDGIRVWLDGQLLIDNWTWHVPSVDSARFTLDEPREVRLRVEHFELDGHASLQVVLVPWP